MVVKNIKIGTGKMLKGTVHGNSMAATKLKASPASMKKRVARTNSLRETEAIADFFLKKYDKTFKNLSK